MNTTVQRSARSRRRERHQKEMAVVHQMAQPVLKIPVYELAGEEAIELIHRQSMRVLAEVGIDFYDAEARAILKENGVDVRGDTAFFEPGLIDEFIAKAPSQFSQLARNPDRNVTIGGKNLCFVPVYGPPFVYDIEFGRREARLEDFINFVKLAYQSPYLHHSGGTIVEPTDVPVDTRHLDMLYSHIKYSDKPFMGSVMSAENAADSVAMAEILYGADEIRQNPALISLINVSSPRRLDDRMLGALTTYARAKQAVIITPFIMAGAMSPASVAGTLIQQNAEALAGLVYAQMVQPGTPVVYGSFMTNVDLKSGAPMFGSPESQMALVTSAQLARRYHLPFRSGGMFTSSKMPDAQAAYESVMTMLPAVQAGVNFVLHAAGWLENGLSAGYEKFMMDTEVLGMLHTLARGLDVSEEGQAMESILSVPPDGHHLGTEHTMRNFRTAFHRPAMFDYNPFEQWEEEGAKDIYRVASDKVKQSLAEYQAPALDPALDDALQEFINKRKSEIG